MLKAEVSTSGIWFILAKLLRNNNAVSHSPNAADHQRAAAKESLNLVRHEATALFNYYEFLLLLLLLNAFGVPLKEFSQV